MLAILRKCIFLIAVTMISCDVFAEGNESTCSSLASCDQFKEKLNEPQEKLTPPVTFLDVEKDSSGKPLLLTQTEAIAFCKKIKAHLPSALEMTQFATLQGAPTALSTKDIYEKYDGEVPEGYKKIKSVNALGVKESFFYSQQGYKAPEDALQAGWLWTSSTLNKANKDGFLFFGASGSFIYGENIQNAKSSFLCVK